MKLTHQLARHLREVHFGGNWTCSNLRDQLAGLSWKQATRQVYDLNSIASLTFHAGYYVSALLKVLEGGPLDSKDEYSFQLPPIKCQKDWDLLLDQIWLKAESAAVLIEQLPDQKLAEDFTDPKYGTWFRNIAGIIEHMHYHLGQIVLIKKVMEKST